MKKLQLLAMNIILYIENRSGVLLSNIHYSQSAIFLLNVLAMYLALDSGAIKA